MSTNNNLSIFTAFICSLVLSFPAVAQNYSCEDTNYTNSLKAIHTKSFTDRMNIIKSWIPDKFTINSCNLTFTGWEPLALERPPKNGIYHAKFVVRNYKKLKRTRYRVHIQEEGKGYISMAATEYVTMGPIPIMCKVVHDNSSSKSCLDP